MNTSFASIESSVSMTPESLNKSNSKIKRKGLSVSQKKTTVACSSRLKRGENWKLKCQKLSSVNKDLERENLQLEETRRQLIVEKERLLRDEAARQTITPVLVKCGEKLLAAVGVLSTATKLNNLTLGTALEESSSKSLMRVNAEPEESEELLNVASSNRWEGFGSLLDQAMIVEPSNITFLPKTADERISPTSPSLFDLTPVGVPNLLFISSDITKEKSEMAVKPSDGGNTILQDDPSPRDANSFTNWPVNASNDDCLLDSNDEGPALPEGEKNVSRKEHLESELNKFSIQGPNSHSRVETATSLGDLGRHEGQTDVSQNVTPSSSGNEENVHSKLISSQEDAVKDGLGTVRQSQTLESREELTCKVRHSAGPSFIAVNWRCPNGKGLGSRKPQEEEREVLENKRKDSKIGSNESVILNNSKAKKSIAPKKLSRTTPVHPSTVEKAKKINCRLPVKAPSDKCTFESSREDRNFAIKLQSGTDGDDFSFKARVKNQFQRPKPYAPTARKCAPKANVENQSGDSSDADFFKPRIKRAQQRSKHVSKGTWENKSDDSSDATDFKSTVKTLREKSEPVSKVHMGNQSEEILDTEELSDTEDLLARFKASHPQTDSQSTEKWNQALSGKDHDESSQSTAAKPARRTYNVTYSRIETTRSESGNEEAVAAVIRYEGAGRASKSTMSSTASSRLPLRDDRSTRGKQNSSITSVAAERNPSKQKKSSKRTRHRGINAEDHDTDEVTAIVPVASEVKDRKERLPTESVADASGQTNGRPRRLPPKSYKLPPLNTKMRR